MDYLLKSSAVILLFYISYQLLLQRETFFEENRLFLMTELMASVLVSMIVIPLYTDVHPTAVSLFVLDPSLIPEPQVLAPTELPFTVDLQQILWLLYTIGIVVFTGKFILELASLLLFIKRHTAI